MRFEVPQFQHLVILFPYTISGIENRVIAIISARPAATRKRVADEHYIRTFLEVRIALP
jgi:hypothetical protein